MPIQTAQAGGTQANFLDRSVMPVVVDPVPQAKGLVGKDDQRTK